MHTSSSFAIKLLVHDVFSCDIAAWETEDRATFNFNDTLKFERVWLQGHVKWPQADGNFTLDDGTGGILVAPTALPATVPKPNISTGDYVVVIGRLLPGDSQSPSPDNYTVKAQKVRIVRTSGAGPAWRKEVAAIHEQVYAAT